MYWYILIKLNKDKNPSSSQENGAGMQIGEDAPQITP